MNPVRRLFADLVERRLWPVALALLVAAVAMPLLIGGGGSDVTGAPGPSVGVPAPSTSSTASAVELVGPPAVRSRSGAVRDPFRRSKPADAASDPTASKPLPSGGAGGGASKTASASKSGGSAGSPETTTTAAQKPAAQPVSAVSTAARSSYQTVVRFTRLAGVRERPLARLAVLGNAAHPALQYVGVRRGREALFVLGPDATVTSGDPDCVIADPCRAIALRQGDRIDIAVAAAGQPVRHYQLEISSMRRLHLPSAEAASAWRKRVDGAGPAVREALRQDPQTAAVLSRLKYAPASGTVSVIAAP